MAVLQRVGCGVVQAFLKVLYGFETRRLGVVGIEEINSDRCFTQVRVHMKTGHQHATRLRDKKYG